MFKFKSRLTFAQEMAGDNEELVERFNEAYADYLQSLADDSNVSIQDWIENIIFYHDNDRDRKDYGIDTCGMLLKPFSSHFSEIYHHSSEKQIQHAKEIIEERTDIFPDDFIEKNL